MSMYTQQAYPNQSYSHQSYATTSSAPYYDAAYSPPLPAPYQPPQPSPQDIHVFRQWFIQQLAPLVENNRAVIHRLAYIAREHAQRFAPVISQCLEQHIRRIHPAIKLPAWYLLDSVSKNLGPPYTVLFASFIASLFIDSYEAVDDSTRNKMEEMLVTWRTGGPSGVELFGANVQHQIERSVWGDFSSAASSGPTANQVLIELDVILAQKTRAVDTNPSDLESRSHVEVLRQLRGMVENSRMSSADLSAIVARLRDLARTTASAAPALPAMPPPVAHHTYPSVSYSPPPPSYPPQMATMLTQAAYNTPAVGSISSILSSLSQPSVPSVSAVASTPVPDVSALFKKLVAAGLINSGQQDDAPKFEPIIEPKPAIEVDPKESVMRAYEKNIMSMKIVLTASGLQKPQPGIIATLYSDLPLKCKQCSKRFADTENGRKARDNHLDTHFKQNKRAGAAVGRGHCRSWFIGAEDWIQDISNKPQVVDVKGKGRADDLGSFSHGRISVKAQAVAAAAEKEAKLRAMQVVVPSGDETKTITCPICKEQLKTEFNEDEEEWVWRNAINVKGKLYHATCHADARSSMAAARIRDQVAAGVKSDTPTSRSRSSTPQTEKTPLPHTSTSASSLAPPTLLSPLRRTDSTFVTPPPAPVILNASLPSTPAQVPVTLTAGTKRKSPSRDEDAVTVVNGSGLMLTALAEVSDALEARQGPSKRARSSSPSQPSSLVPVLQA